MKSIAATALVAMCLLAQPAKSLCDDAAAGGVKVGEELVLMADGPGQTMRSYPAVAFGKDVFPVAWQEGWQGKEGSSRVFLARVGLDGKVLDPKGIEIAACKTGVQEYPRVAFFDGVFLVVWNDMRNGKDCDVLAARVSPAGKVLDEKPIAVAAGPRTQAMPDVAADEKGFMVVWHGFQDKDMFPKVFAARVGADGILGNPAVLTAGASCPRIAWNGKEHLVIYSTNRRKAWLRMDPAGKVVWNPERRTWSEGLQGNPFCSVCGLSREKGWAMVYHGGQPNWWYRALGIQRTARITPAGKIDAAPGDVMGHYGPKGGVVPPNWLDTSYRKKTQRNVGGSAATPTMFPYGGSALAQDGRHCVVVWQRYYMGGASNLELVNGDLLGSRLDAWKPLDKPGIPVATSTAEEINPALAGNGAGKLLCVYEKVVDGRSSIAARTLQTRQLPPE